MKKWKCSVCGYIHKGDEPPEKCPVCSADRSLFVEIPSEVPAEPAAVSADTGADRWKCIVCGYIHRDTAAPDACPVCGSAKDQFEGMAAESEPITVVSPAAAPAAPEAATAQPEPGASPKAAVGPDAPFRDRVYETAGRLLTKHHAHPITVHIPCGVLPVSVIFMMMAAFFGCSALKTAALCNMIIVVLAMPAVLFSGYNDWQRRFGGHLTSVFRTKIVCGGVILVLSLVLTLWLAVDPDLLATASTGRRFFFFLSLIMMAAAVVAGLMGGKLVFINQEDE